MFDLTSLSLQDLKKLDHKIASEIEKRAGLAKKNLLKQLQKMAAAEGMALSDVVSVKQSSSHEAKKKTGRVKKAGKKREPVYFHQADVTKSWSGQGRKPGWVITWLENGGALEGLKKRPS